MTHKKFFSPQQRYESAPRSDGERGCRSLGPRRGLWNCPTLLAARITESRKGQLEVMGVEETQGSGVEEQEAYLIVRREVRVRLVTVPPPVSQLHRA
jgi:hypothetical protein